MSKFAPIALLATVATLAFVPSVVFAAETQPVQAAADSVAGNAVAATAGSMLYGPDGNRIASVYRVTSNGSAQIILNGRLVTVPASSLSEANGKLATSLTKRELGRR